MLVDRSEPVLQLEGEVCHSDHVVSARRARLRSEPRGRHVRRADRLDLLNARKLLLLQDLQARRGTGYETSSLQQFLSLGESIWE